MRIGTAVKVALAALLVGALCVLAAGCTAGATTPSTTSASSSVATSTPASGTPAPLKPVRAGAVAPPSSGCLLGIFRPPAPFKISALDAYAVKVAEKRPAIVMWYQQWGSSTPNRFDPGMVADVYARGQLPMISWEPWDPGAKPHNIANPADAPAWSLASIVAGKRDAYIRSWARDIAAMGGPIMIRPMHEMNGDWYPWSGTANGNTPAEYIAAWRHIHDIFVAEGADNATFVWSVNVNSKPFTPENAYSAYYPGDAYVDWVGVSGFNVGTNRISGRRNLFNELFDTPLSYLSTLGKPIVICESASVQKNADKPAWIADAYTQLSTSHKEVKAFVYYDALEKGVRHGTQDFRITSSPEARAAYQSAIAPDYFIGAPQADVEAWKAQLAPAQQAKLAHYARIY